MKFFWNRNLTFFNGIKRTAHCMPFSYSDTMKTRLALFVCQTTISRHDGLYFIAHLALGQVSVTEAEEKEPLLKSPGNSISGAEPDTRPRRCLPSFLLILLLSLAYSRSHGGLGCSRGHLPESVLTIYRDPADTWASQPPLAFPGHLHTSHLLPHLWGWSRWPEAAPRPTHPPQSRLSWWSTNKLITGNLAPIFEGCPFWGRS